MGPRKTSAGAVNMLHGATEHFEVPGELIVFRCGPHEFERIESSLGLSGNWPDHVAMVLVLSGNVNGIVDHEMRRFQKGDLVVVPAHGLRLIQGEEGHGELLTVCFSMAFTKRVKLRGFGEQVSLLRARGFPSLRLDQAQTNSFVEIASRLAQRIATMPAHTFGMDLVATVFLELVLEVGHIGKCNGAGFSPASGRKQALVDGFMKLAGSHFLQERHLSFYSNHLFVSNKHLSETMKEVTGRTAARILDDLLLQEAKRLLDETTLSIGEVAFHLGFSDPSQFSKFFRKMAQRSPRDFRDALSAHDRRDVIGTGRARPRRTPDRIRNQP